ncbi:MAG: TadE/TadG family type IV pilus assembly protein [Isosphaeraceae bacterium]
MRHPTRIARGRPRPGIAAVEMALCLPLLLMLLIGTWEVARILEIQQFLEVGAREAARQASSGLFNNEEVRQIAIAYVRQALGDQDGTMTGNLSVEVSVSLTSSPDTPTEIDVSEAGPLDLLEVTVSIPYSDVRWINLPMITSASTLRGKATWVSLKNFPYPTTPPEPPTG